MRDFSGNTVRYPETSLAVEGGSNGGDVGGGGEGFIEFLVIETLGQLVDAARLEIASIINNHPTNLAAKFVRMAFHDCVGGCDGSVRLAWPCVNYLIFFTCKLLNKQSFTLSFPLFQMH